MGLSVNDLLGKLDPDTPIEMAEPQPETPKLDGVYGIKHIKYFLKKVKKRKKKLVSFYIVLDV